MKNIILGLALILSFQSFAQEWELLNSDEGKQFHIRTHSKNTAWIKETKDATHIDNEGSNDKIVKTLTLYKFDCENKKLGILAYTTYNDKGKVVDSDQMPDVLVDMLYVLPESYGEFFLNYFCEFNVENYEKDKTDSEGYLNSKGYVNIGGVKGEITGDPNARGYYGNGGSGGSGDYQLGGRRALNRATPAYDCEEEGLIVVEIEVNREGKVIKAIAGTEGSTNTAECLLSSAQEAALKSTWEPDSKASVKQVGIIKYRFSLSN